MPKGSKWPAATKQRAVEMYEAGHKYKEITAETGVPMATVIAWLHELGIRPQRLQKATTEVTVDQVLKQLALAQAEVGRLELGNDLLRAENDMLREELERVRSNN